MKAIKPNGEIMREKKMKLLEKLEKSNNSAMSICDPLLLCMAEFLLEELEVSRQEISEGCQSSSE